ncbi:MAG: DUF2500 family protein [Clostridia bacterium]|nr:DUF2500 family protein [Clostridia bacterium]
MSIMDMLESESAFNGIFNNSPNAGSLIIFEFEDGNRQEFAVNTSASSTLVEGDTGKLTYQGTKFLRFERD